DACPRSAQGHFLRRWSPEEVRLLTAQDQRGATDGVVDVPELDVLVWWIGGKRSRQMGVVWQSERTIGLLLEDGLGEKSPFCIRMRPEGCVHAPHVRLRGFQRGKARALREVGANARERSRVQHRAHIVQHETLHR